MPAPTDLLNRLLAVTALLERDMAQALGALGLTASRTHLLWELHRLGPSTQQALAVALEVSPRNVTGLLDALEQDGFVDRRRHPTDRRAALVTLTERGERVMGRMAEDHERLAGDLFGGLPRDDAEVLGRALDTIGARLNELMAAAAHQRGAR